MDVLAREADLLWEDAVRMESDEVRVGLQISPSSDAVNV